MKNRTHRLLLTLPLLIFPAAAQTLSSHWEELTAPDFVKALDQAKSVCLLPFEIIEKHGRSGL